MPRENINTFFSFLSSLEKWIAYKLLDFPRSHRAIRVYTVYSNIIPFCMMHGNARYWWLLPHFQSWFRAASLYDLFHLSRAVHEICSESYGLQTLLGPVCASVRVFYFLAQVHVDNGSYFGLLTHMFLYPLLSLSCCPRLVLGSLRRVYAAFNWKIRRRISSDYSRIYCMYMGLGICLYTISRSLAENVEIELIRFTHHCRRR